MTPVEGIVFDLDGTLIDSKKDLALAVRFLQHTKGRPLSTEKEVASFIGDGVVKLVQRALPGLSAEELDPTVTRFKRYYHEHCLDHTRLYPGVKDTLRHFRRKKMAVVTNKPARVSRHILEGLGVLPCFQVVFGGDTLASKKPSPEPISHALQAMEIEFPKQAIIVGDSVNDIQAGRAAGTWTCGILSNISRPSDLRAVRPDYLILKLTELQRIIS